MKKIFYAIIILAISMVSLLSFGCKKDEETSQPTRQPPLFFNGNGEFTIVQFTDFHEWVAKEKNVVAIDEQDNLKPHLEQYIKSVLASEKPDFVVITGDNIFCLSWLDYLFQISEKTMRLIAEIFEEAEIYWTFTFGNHDTEGAATKESFIKSVAGYEYFIGGLSDGEYYKALSYKAGKDDYRAGNYAIPIYSADKQSVAYNVFLLDSGSYDYAPPASVPYRYILDAQVDWYQSIASASKTSNGAIVPSVMFTHIPLFEHAEAYGQQGESIGVWTGISPSDTRSSIFETAMEIGDVKAIFCGHNHSNSYTGFYQRDDKKIMMGITPQAAADSYEDTASIMYSRIIRLSEKGGLLTYINTSDTTSDLSGVYKNEYLEFPVN